MTKQFLDGRYTVAFVNDEVKGHRTFEIATSENPEFMPGAQILGYLKGSNNLSDYQQFAHIRQDGSLRIWDSFTRKKNTDESLLVKCARVLIEGEYEPAQAGRLFSRLTFQVLGEAKCYVCMHPLTDPVSIKLGIGPICRGER